MSAPDAFVVLAVVGAAHGIRGELRVRTHLADPLDLDAYGPLRLPDGRTLTVKAVRYLKDDMVVARFAEIADRTAAEALNGCELSVLRDVLPAVEDDETFYHTDLIGLTARHEDGRVIGRINAVFDFGAGDMLEVRPTNGAALLFPFTKAVVPVVDLAAGHVIIVPPLETEVRE